MTVVDNSFTNVGQWSSAANVNGFPAIAYWDQTFSAVKFARATATNGSSWGTPIQVITGASGYCSLTVLGGASCISFQTSSNTLGFVRALDANGDTWPPITTTYTYMAV